MQDAIALTLHYLVIREFARGNLERPLIARAGFGACNKCHKHEVKPNMK